MVTIIQLLDGKTVSLDEFLTWSVHKQRMNTVPISAETREKISAANKGRVAWNKGIPLSDKTKAKLSAAKLGKTKTIPVSDETKAKLSAAMLGKERKPFTDATKAKIAAAKCKPVTTPNGTFPSITAAAAGYKVRGNVIQYRMKKYPNQYYFVARPSTSKED